jgi:hypothetical protein
MTGMKKEILKWAGSRAIFISTVAALVSNVGAQTPSLSLSGASGAPGTTITIPVSLNPGTGTAPASVQWDLTYSASDLSLVSGTYDTTGAAGSGAGKLADCNSISAGDVRCIISGINTTGIGNGVVATLSFQIAGGATDASTPVSLTGVAASDGGANSLNITDSGATVQITQPSGPVVSGLNCNPASVTPPASSTCTVTMSGAVAGTTTVNLTSSASAATVPASVNITSGLSSTTFAVTTSTVVASTPAEITATVGANSQIFWVTLTPVSSCAYSLSANSSSLSSSVGSGSFNVVTTAGCPWTVTNNSSFITITSGSSGTGNGTVSYSFTANAGDSRIGTLTIATQTFTAIQSGQTSAGLAFYPLMPCRIADTRTGFGFSGSFGPPSLAQGSTRVFPIPQSSCGVPGTAQAYSLNITVLPTGPLGYLTSWPTGTATPSPSTINSPSGSIVANAAIVPTGTNADVSLYASNDTNVLIDINGYFAPPGGPEALAFYPVTPCRVADTRTGFGFSGAFGPPALVAQATRNFPVQQSSCGIPSTAQLYSVRMTTISSAPLSYLTTWPEGVSLPVVSTLNAPDGGVVGNQAIIPAGAQSGGPISVFVSNNANLLIDINGYFAPPGGAGAVYFYPLTPCRVADTRTGFGFSGAFGPPSLAASGGRNFPMLSSSCGIPSSAQVYSLNMTAVVPSGGALGYLTAFPAGASVPNTSTINAPNGGVVGSAAIVPAGTNGAVSVFSSNVTDLLIDISGYFAP